MPCCQSAWLDTVHVEVPKAYAAVRRSAKRGRVSRRRTRKSKVAEPAATTEAASFSIRTRAVSSSPPRATQAAAGT